jgi:hypothetical protein
VTGNWPVSERPVAIRAVRALIQPSYPLPAGQRRPAVVVEGGSGSGKTEFVRDSTRRSATS